MAAGAIGTRHCSPGGGATDRADLHYCLQLYRRTAGRAASGHPLVTRHEFEGCDRLCSMVVARQGGGRQVLFQERLWDDHK